MLLKKLTLHQKNQFFIFIAPSYLILALIFIALAIWKVGLDELDLIPLAWTVVANIVASILLVKKQYWIGIVMVLFGVYVIFQGQNYQFTGHAFIFYGSYLIVHYSACTLYVFKNR